jgi:hypothetical protein
MAEAAKSEDRLHEINGAAILGGAIAGAACRRDHEMAASIPFPARRSL